MTSDTLVPKESLTVDGLGGLVAATFHLSKVNVFIGPQASGKSLAAKLAYFCKSYPRQIMSAIYDDMTYERLKGSLSERFFEYFSAAVNASSSFEVTYDLYGEGVTIKCGRAKKGTRRKIEIEGSQFFKDEYATLRRVYGKHIRKIEIEDEKRDFALHRFQENFIKKIRDRFGDKWGMQQVFVPSGRSYFSFLQGSIFSLLSNNVPLDPFVKEFGSSYERYKSLSVRSDPEMEPIQQQVEAILKGRYERFRTEDYIVAEDQRRIPISSSSSGQQEALPLLVMLQYFHRLSRSPVGRSVYIEEPEAHLFPDSQKRLVELLIYILGLPNRPAQVFITTHSPYVCATLNNLILAGDQVASIGASARLKLRDITTMGSYVAFDDLSVLALDGGHPKSILDGEARLIDSRYLDRISEELVTQRENLLEIGS